MPEDRYYVIGGGWYGCFVSHFLAENHIPYVLVESRNDLFTGASRFNQNRLHLGFHYPRSFTTRDECKEGFYWFNNNFPALVSEVQENFYAIHDNSFLDYGTYKAIFENEGYEFEEVASEHLENIDAVIKVEEQFINPDEAAAYWKSEGLNAAFNCEAKIMNNMLFINDEKVTDVRGIIDCTWGNITGRAVGYEEYFLSLVLEPRKETTHFGALTVMDGPFFSIYPYTNGRFTLTHVSKGVLPNGSITPEQLDILTKEIITSVKLVYPSFDRYYKTIDFFISRKFKRHTQTADRSLQFASNTDIPQHLEVLSGKIDSLYRLNSKLTEFLL